MAKNDRAILYRVGRSASLIFRILGYIFAGMSALLVILVFSSNWFPAQSFDLAGFLFLMQNAPFFFGLGFAAVFAAAAIGCWLMAIRASWM
jgi:hypothetical protein